MHKEREDLNIYIYKRGVLFYSSSRSENSKGHQMGHK